MDLKEMSDISNVAEYAAYLFKYFRRGHAASLYEDFRRHVNECWNDLNNHQQRVLWAQLETVYGSAGLNLGNPAPAKPVVGDWMDLRTGKILESDSGKRNWAPPAFSEMHAILY